MGGLKARSGQGALAGADAWPVPDDPALAERVLAWSAIASGSDHPDGLERMLGALRKAFAEIGEVTVPEVAPGLRALSARRPGRSPRVLLVGHHDTVYGADLGTPPHRDGALLRGPGVADMKGGLVVMLEALRAAGDDLDWEVLVVPDEETGTLLSRPLLEETARRADIALVFEPAFDGCVIGSRMATGFAHLVATGRAAHAGRDPWNGRNAVVALADAVASAARLDDRAGGIRVNVARVEGGGPLNVVPDRAEAWIDLRLAGPGQVAAIERALPAACDEASRTHDVAITVDVVVNRPPMPPDPRRDALIGHYRAGAERLGVEVGIAHSGGGSDGNFLAACGLPVLDGLGVRGGALHGPDEYCVAASVAERASACALLLRDIAAGRVQPG